MLRGRLPTRFLAILRSLKCLCDEETHEVMQAFISEARIRKEIMRRHAGLVIEPKAVVLGYREDLFRVGKARVAQGTVLSFGDTVTGFGTIEIGDDTWIGQYNNLRASENASIVIGSKCLISQFCTLVGANHKTTKGIAMMDQPLEAHRRGVLLGNDVWLGAGCTVLPGVSIGNGAIVGAGSVVTRNIPANEIWGGVPSRKISERTDTK